MCGFPMTCSYLEFLKRRSYAEEMFKIDIYNVVDDIYNQFCLYMFIRIICNSNVFLFFVVNAWTSWVRQGYVTTA